MSADPSALNPTLRAYLADHAPAEDDALRNLREAAADAELPAIHIGPAQGAMMQMLLQLVGAREVVEVGTLGGYSAVWMARGLASGGRLRTLEIDARHAAFAREHVGHCGVGDVVEVIEGDARSTIETLQPTVDAVFIDADKAGYRHYIEHALRILRPGGLLLVDNAFAFGELFDEGSSEASVLAIREVNDALHADERVSGVICPLGDGFWVCRKL